MSEHTTSLNHFNILLAIKGRADNVSLLDILSTVEDYDLRIKNVRTAEDFFEKSQDSSFQLIIADSSLFTEDIFYSLKKHHHKNQLSSIIVSVDRPNVDTQHISEQLTEAKIIKKNSSWSLNLKDEINNILNEAFKNLSIDSNSNTQTDSCTIDVVFDHDNEPEIISTSNNFSKISKTSLNKIKQSHHWLGNVFEHDTAALQTLVENIFNGENANCNFTTAPTEGELLHFNLEATPTIKNNAVNGFTGLISHLEKYDANDDLTNKQIRRANLHHFFKAKISQFNNSSSIFKECTDTIRSELNADIVEFYISSNDNNSYRLQRTSNIRKTPLFDFDNKEVLAFVNSTLQTTYIPDLNATKQLQSLKFVKNNLFDSVLLIPLKVSTGITGFFIAYMSPENLLEDNDISFCESIAHSFCDFVYKNTTKNLLTHKIDETILNDLSNNIDSDEDTLATEVSSLEPILQNALDLRSRDQFMEAIAKISELFLQSTLWQDIIDDAMNILSRASFSKDVKLFKLRQAQGSSISCDLVHSTGSDFDSNRKKMTIEAPSIEIFIEYLSSGQCISTNESTHFNKKDIEFFSAIHLKDNLLVPIEVNNRWWGFIAFSNNAPKHEWALSVINSVKVAANIIGSAISRSEYENSLHALTEASVNNSGEKFLNTLTKKIALFIQADICTLSKIDAQNKRSNISFWSKDSSITQASHGENITNNSSNDDALIICSGNAQKAFPENQAFKNLGITSYISQPIHILENQVIGHLEFMAKKPIQLTNQQLQILEISASRASIELDRLQREGDINRLARIPLESPNMLVALDSTGELIFSNPSAKRTLRKLKGKLIFEILPQNHEQIIKKLVEKPEDNVLKVDCIIESFLFQWSYHYEADVNLIYIYGADLTDRKVLEDKLRNDAFNDALTSLPNRTYFNSVLQKSFDHVSRRKSYKFAVLFLDLDRFKVINDSLGHIFGDKLLQEVANRIQLTIRPGDTVARFGGDEFAILLDSINQTSEVTTIAKRIISSFEKPFLIDENEIYTSTSIGIALSNSTYKSIEDIVRDADIAMYNSKNNSKGNYSFFDAEMHKEAIKVMELENDLRRAVSNDEFECFYQPIFSIKEGKITGFESLVRWNHPTQGFTSPDAFIPVAEETGVVREIDLIVLEKSCAFLKQAHADLPKTKNLTISVNLSAIHFSRPSLAEEIIELIEKHDIAPSQIKLEVTESTIMENYDETINIFNNLKKIGIKISIDDFGVGYSSLGRLISMPVDTLKIDKSFVHDMMKNESSFKVTTAITELADSLNLDVIAEGVETDTQLSMLKELGCEFIQGYFISKPLPLNETQALLIEQYS